MVPEVIEVEAKTQSVRPDNPSHLVQKGRFPVGSQAHHLVLIAVLREPQVLSDSCVEDPQGMREADLTEEPHPIVLADSPLG